MKNARLLILCTLFVALQSSLLGVNITNVSGRVYSNVVVKGVQPDGLRCVHSSGVAFLPFVDLPAEVRREYGYDMEAEKAYLAGREKAERQSKALGIIRRSRLQATIQIIQITEDGALATGYHEKSVEYIETEYQDFTRTVGLVGPSTSGTVTRRIPVRDVKRTKTESWNLGDRVYVFGVPESLVDGDWYKTALYPCGRHQYINTLGAQVTVERYATTPENALRLLAIPN